MTAKEFLEEIKKLNIKIYQKDQVSWQKDHYSVQNKKNKITLSDCLYVEWSIGSSTRSYTKCGEPEPDFWEFDVLLLHLCPNINYLQYKSLANSVIQKKHNTYSGYYEDCSHTATKKAILQDLYDKMTEMKLI